MEAAEVTSGPKLGALERIAVSLIILALAFVAHDMWASKLDVSRFVADSISHATDHQLLLQIDRRTTDMWCQQVPMQVQQSCHDLNRRN